VDQSSVTPEVARKAVTPAALARQLLLDTPGDALCDPCLALVCGTTLTEMREITTGLLDRGLDFHPAAICASCRRPMVAIVYRTKCAHCSSPLAEDDPGSLVDGERLHFRCWRLLVTDDTIRLSRAMSRRSRELIEQSRRRIRSGRRPWPRPSD